MNLYDNTKNNPKKTSSQTLSLFLLHGKPEGVKILEIQNKALRIYIVPRLYLTDIKDRNDLEQPAIYFLITEDHNKLYVGEAENSYNRILQHSTKEWETALICLSNNNSLDKADVKYLEAYFIRTIREINNIQLSNENTPKFNNLHEFRRSGTEEFAEYIRTGLASLGYKFLQHISKNLKEEKIKEQAFWYLKARGGNAKGILIGDGFVLLKGSVINSVSTPNFINNKNFENKRQNILKQKTKVLEYNFCETLEDINFTSINQAACFVVGNSVNAWLVWKNKEGLTMDEVKRKNTEII